MTSSSPRGGATAGPVPIPPIVRPTKDAGQLLVDPRVWFKRAREVSWCDPKTFPQVLPFGLPGYGLNNIHTWAVDARDPDILRCDVYTMQRDTAAGTGSIQFRKWNGAAWVNDGAAVVLTCMNGALVAGESLLRHYLLASQTWVKTLPFLPCILTLPAGWASTAGYSAAGYTVEPLADLLPSGGSATPTLAIVRAFGSPGANFTGSTEAHIEPSLWLFFDGPVKPGSAWYNAASPTFPFTPSRAALNPAGKWEWDSRFPNCVRVQIGIGQFQNAAGTLVNDITLTALQWVVAADGTPLAAPVLTAITRSESPPRFSPLPGPGGTDEEDGRRFSPVSAMLNVARPALATPQVWEGVFPSEPDNYSIDNFTDRYRNVPGVASIGDRAATVQGRAHACNRAFIDGNAWARGQRGSVTSFYYGVDGPSMYIRAEVDSFFNLAINAVPPTQSDWSATNIAGVMLATALPAGYTLDAPVFNSQLEVYNTRTRLPALAETRSTLSTTGGFPVGDAPLGFQQVANAAPVAPPFYDADPDPTSVSHHLLWLATKLYAGVAPPALDGGFSGARHGWLVGDVILIPIYHLPYRDVNSIYPLVWQPVLEHLPPVPLPILQTDPLNLAPTDFWAWVWPAEQHRLLIDGEVVVGEWAGYFYGPVPGVGDGFTITITIYESQPDPTIPVDLVQDQPGLSAPVIPGGWVVANVSTVYCGDPYQPDPIGDPDFWVFPMGAAFTFAAASVLRPVVLIEYAAAFADAYLGAEYNPPLTWDWRQYDIPFPVPIKSLVDLTQVIPPRIVDGNAHIP